MFYDMLGKTLLDYSVSGMFLPKIAMTLKRKICKKKICVLNIFQSEAKLKIKYK